MYPVPLLRTPLLPPPPHENQNPKRLQFLVLSLQPVGSRMLSKSREQTFKSMLKVSILPKMCG